MRENSARHYRYAGPIQREWFRKEDVAGEAIERRPTGRTIDLRGAPPVGYSPAKRHNPYAKRVRAKVVARRRIAA
jgi:hypothetical protein